jgi:hypothetical protein
MEYWSKNYEGNRKIPGHHRGKHYKLALKKQTINTGCRVVWISGK